MDEDICSYSQQCVEESTILIQGRIILWAGGSLADDGSTVKTSVPIFNSAWMKIYLRILNSAWMKICVRILKSVWRKTVLTQGRIILWAGGSLADDGSTVTKQVFLYSTVGIKIHLSTILTQGRIILWAGGSLADDGSTVKTSVLISNIAWMKICVRILNSVWRKALFSCGPEVV